MNLEMRIKIRPERRPKRIPCIVTPEKEKRVSKDTLCFLVCR
jgi:hypothetical protein